VEIGDLEQCRKSLLQFAGLVDFERRRASHLSGGMKKKLALACTLIHDPPILLLDEPTTGVDPVSRREFWDILTELHIDGTTVVVSTPYMDEADRCSRVGLMYDGRLLVCDEPQAIRDQVEDDLIEVLADDWQAAHAVAANLPGVLEVQTYGESLHLLLDPDQLGIAEVEATFREHGVSYRSIRPVTPRMEEAFISLIRRAERSEA